MNISFEKNQNQLLEKLEGHHFAVTYKDEDCDFGSCTGYIIKNLGITIYTYDDDPTRLSIHYGDE